jgi:hypothetical protein
MQDKAGRICVVPALIPREKHLLIDLLLMQLSPRAFLMWKGRDFSCFVGDKHHRDRRAS